MMMKNSTITADRKKTELIIFLFCFILSQLLNVYAILHFHTDWKELYTMLGVTVMVSIIIYFLLGILRIVYYYLLKAIKLLRS